MKYTSRRDLLERTNALPNLYHRIKDLAEDGVYEALPILAQYQNPADTMLFENLLSNDEFSSGERVLKNRVRSAVICFPHPCFYPILKKQLLSEIGTNEISDEFESFPLYLALVQYPTRQTRRLFETALKKSGDEFTQRSAFIFKAIQKYPSPTLNGVVRDSPAIQKYWQ